jgi:hypothetical protein
MIERASLSSPPPSSYPRFSQAQRAPLPRTDGNSASARARHASRQVRIEIHGWRERPDVTPAPIVLASAGPSIQPRRGAARTLQPDVKSALSWGCEVDSVRSVSVVAHPRRAPRNVRTLTLTVPTAILNRCPKRELQGPLQWLGQLAGRSDASPSARPLVCVVASANRPWAPSTPTGLARRGGGRRLSALQHEEV